MPNLLDCLGKEPWYETVLFSNIVRNILKHFSQHRLLRLKPQIVYIAACYEIPMHITTVGAQVPLSACASARLPSLPQRAWYPGLTPSCVRTMLPTYLSLGLFDTTWDPQAIPHLGLAIYYLALWIILQRCFPKCGLMLSIG